MCMLAAAGCGESTTGGPAQAREPAPGTASAPPPVANDRDAAIDTASEEPVAPAVQVDPPAAQRDAGFVTDSVAVSAATLGDFPYFTLPEGYRNPNRPIPVR